MSTNRLSWIGVVLVVLIVGGLVVRTLRHDASIGSRPAALSTGGDVNNVASPRDGVRDSTHFARRGEKIKSTVERAKVVLTAKGFYHGRLNGNFDIETQEALKKFQASLGRKPTGYLDKPTYDALGIDLKNPRN
jgi:peptidoglycan hydrolase-like protein with peptidoglycan-binding domain